jgi:Domain of unknown function (DUF4209)
MQPVVPAAIEEVVARFDPAGEPVDEHEIRGALVEARGTLKDAAPAENLGAWAEVLAFALMGGAHGESPWGTYFRPLGSGTRRDGSILYAPDIAGTDAEAVDHWSARANAIKHPVLKARYADLAWDMSRAIASKSPDPEMARIAIDAYLASITQCLRKEVNDRFNAALRALDLGLMLGDQPRVEAARRALLELHKEAVAAEQGLWWIAYDRLIDDKRPGLTDSERDQLVADLEGIVVRRADASDPKVFDPHATEGAAKRLIKFYRKNSKGEDARRLSAVIARAFEHFASLGDAMVASAALQTSVNAYREAGMREESQRARVAMEEKIAKSRDEMKPIAIERTIPKETVEQFLESVVVGNIGTTFARIASEFLQGRKGLEDQIKRMEETSPLAAHIPRSIVGDRHVAAKVGSLADDPFGHLINQAAQMVGLSDFWLFHALTRAVEAHQITPYHFATWAGRTKLFDDLTLIMEGVTAWYDQDFVKAIHVLVPQIEVGLRSIVAQMGKPVTKSHPTIPGVSVAIGMGDMLYAKDVKEALGDDLTIHFLALYADPRGFNLRNDLAHGLLGAGGMTMAVASRVLHTLLVFGIWDALVKARKTPKEDPPAAQ